MTSPASRFLDQDPFRGGSKGLALFRCNCYRETDGLSRCLLPRK